MLISCLPVHKGEGFIIAGIGSSPSQFSLSIHMIRFITYGLVRNVSLRVNRAIPNRLSYTNPITGLFALGVTIY